MRIGHGLDVHAFSDDNARPLWLGLIEVPDAKGLAGHSDADVVTHALCDALLGGANCGDIGRHFPDTDESTKNVSSKKLLEHCVRLVHDAGFIVEAADITIVAQTPKLAPYLSAMSDELSAVVGTVVSLKATTTEGLGALGRSEGIGASAVALLREKS